MHRIKNVYIFICNQMNYVFPLIVESNKYHTASTNVRFSNIDLRFIRKAIEDRCFVQHYMLKQWTLPATEKLFIVDSIIETQLALEGRRHWWRCCKNSFNTRITPSARNDWPKRLFS